jgi:hypothetical protein
MPQALLEPTAELPARSHARKPHTAVVAGRIAGLVVLALLVPTATHLLRVDWVLPPLILLGTASLLRGGSSLLDRLMFALMLLFGAVCAAGLLLSVWPWGLSPLATGALLRRRPSLPRPGWADGLPVLAGAGGALYVGWTYMRVDFGGRLNRAMAGEDLGRHFSIFDNIRQMGGYLFLDPADAHRRVYEGIIRYPQGFHFIAALLDGFLRSSSAPGSSTSAFDHFLGFHNASYGVLMLAVVWAALWIGGPLVRTGLRPLLPFTFLAPFMIYTDLLANYVSGYSSEIFGLTLVALVTAVLARPLPGTRSQLLVVASLLVAIGFSYYLFLPGALLGTLLWLISRRRRVRRHPLFLSTVALLAVPLALTPAVLGMFVGKAADALGARASIRDSRDLLLALLLAILAGILGRSSRRLPVWRRYGAAAAGPLLFAVLLGVYQKTAQGDTGYYFEKALHAVEIALLVGVGALALLVPPPARGGRARLRRQVANALPTVLLAASVGTALGVVNKDSPFRPRVNALASNWGRSWRAGALNSAQVGYLVDTIYRDHPARPAEVTLVFDDNGLRQYDLTLFVSVLQRNGAQGVSRALYGRPANLVRTDPLDLETVLLEIQQPVEAVAMTKKTATFVRDMQVRHPKLRLRLVDLSAPRSPAIR